MRPPTHRLLLLLAAALLLPTALGPQAQAVEVDPLEGLPEGSYRLDENHIAVPLRADTPDEYPPEVIAAAIAAGERGLAYNASTREETALGAGYLFIQPGSWMVSPSLCTIGFVYGTPGAYSISSAGHCTRTGQPVVLALAPSLLVSVGRTVAHRNGGIGADWSLTPVDAAFQPMVRPETAFVSGPQGGMYTAEIRADNPIPIKFTGHGHAIGTPGTPRAGLAFHTSGGAFYFTAPSMEGDSGAPVLTVGDERHPQGQALGLLTHLVIDLNRVPTHMAGTRLSVLPGTPAMAPSPGYTMPV
ncbi:MAG TPA: hypothetical protein VNZ52_07005 [Candidatus Thermoplasmatota archaeon]|nr:hypothetical protein [Candidatus Thermoplasmatota archaeon]